MNLIKIYKRQQHDIFHSRKNDKQLSTEAKKLEQSQSFPKSADISTGFHFYSDASL